jgi:hypothetical protein
MNRIKLKLWLMRLPIIGRVLQNYFVNRLATQERALSSDGTNPSIFSKIYKENLWAEGSTAEGFYSGSGTYSPAGRAYVDFIAGFIQSHKIRSMTDIGSGDFSIGKAITTNLPTLEYNGVDVACEVVAFNEKKYGSDRIRFFCADASKENIPDADLLTIRQVLQHLSNSDIERILEHMSKFKFALITEHVLNPPYLLEGNIDKPSGKSTRAGFGSAVLISQPPFNINCKEVLRCQEDEFGSIVTYLVENG